MGETSFASMRPTTGCQHHWFVLPVETVVGDKPWRIASTLGNLNTCLRHNRLIWNKRQAVNGCSPYIFFVIMNRVMIKCLLPYILCVLIVPCPARNYIKSQKNLGNKFEIFSKPKRKAVEYCKQVMAENKYMICLQHICILYNL